MVKDKTFLFLSIFGLILAGLGLIFVILSHIDILPNNLFTGRITDTSTVNLTVESAAIINFTTDIINWGSGRVTAGFSAATLNTSVHDSTNVTGGNWTSNDAGLILENIGNVNVSLYLKGNKTAAQFIGGTSPLYEWNISNNEAGSCIINSTGDHFNLSRWYTVNASSLLPTAGLEGTYMCRNFTFQNTADTIRIDIRLVVPSDSLSGALSDTITATAFST